jgi:hypothetical protein
MRRNQILRWLSTFLLLAGMLIPAAAATATTGTILLFSQPAQAAQTIDLNNSVVFQFPDMSNMAPGDADPDVAPNLENKDSSFFSVTLGGTQVADVYISTSLTGELTTCDSGQFTVLISDNGGKSYSANLANQPVGTVQPGTTLTFKTLRRLNLSAGNDCQGKSATFTVQAYAVPPPPPPQTDTGTIKVQVLDNSTRWNGQEKPISDAKVVLTAPGGGTYQLLTNAAGEATFAGLPLGTYQVTAESADPQNPLPSTVQTGYATAPLTTNGQVLTVPIRLAWPSPLPGTITVRTWDVTNGAHNPLANANLTLSGPTPGTGTTNTTGQFTFTDRQQGTYTVTASALDPSTGTPVQGSASVDLPEGGSKTVDINFEFAPPPQNSPTKLTVHVEDQSPHNNGQPHPIAGAEVTLTFPDGTVQTGKTDANGNLVFPNVPTGSFNATVSANDPQHPGDASTRQTGTGTGSVTDQQPFVVIPVALRFPDPTGRITVTVMNGSDANNPVPLPGAAVNLGYGRILTTDASGRAVFENLPLGTFTAAVEAVDPRTGSASSRQRVASGPVTLTRDSLDKAVTVTLAWVEPLAEPDPGAITGRICSPKAPGAEVTAAGPGGQTFTKTFPSNGVLGVWREYQFTGAKAGPWTLTLKNADGTTVDQKLTVLSGATVRAGDFTLACTGDNVPVENPQAPLWPYLLGAAMVLAGLVLRQYERRAEQA